MKKLFIFDIFRVFYKPGFLLGGSYDEEMIQLAYNLKQKGKRVVGMTNSIGPFKELDTVFDGKYTGSNLGFFKPEKKFFEYVLENEGVTPEDTVFVDDSQKNIEAASVLGIESFLYTNAKDVEKFLERFL